MGFFPGGPVLASTRMSPFWILLELRIMEVVVTTEGIRHAKLQSNHHQQQTSIQLFTRQMAALPVTNQQSTYKIVLRLNERYSSITVL